MTLQPANTRQLPDHAILDYYNKQTYLGNSYILPISGLSLSDTSETNVVLIQNPIVIGSSFPLQKGIFINLRRFTSSAQQVVIKTYINPTISSTSTPSIPVNLIPASPNMSISACYANGQFSVSSNGTLISSIGCASNDFVVMDNVLLLILDPGQSVLITGTSLVDNTSLDSDISFYEL